MIALQDRLNALRKIVEQSTPPEARVVIDQVISDLIASGAATKALAKGDKAPSFRLLDEEGRGVSSAYLLEDGPLVVAFYRGLWCAYCDLELEALEDALDEIEMRGASLVAVSPQTAANSRKTRREHKLTFPVLADPHSATLDAFGLGWTVPDAMKRVLRSLKIDLALFNGDDSWRLPMPATYVIDSDSVIAYSSVHPDYRTRPDPYDLMPLLDRLNPVKEPLDVHERYGDRPRSDQVIATGVGREAEIQPAGAAVQHATESVMTTWFATLAAELDARRTDQVLTEREHSYAVDRQYNQLPPKHVAQEIFAARLGSGELWTP